MVLTVLCCVSLDCIEHLAMTWITSLFLKILHHYIYAFPFLQTVSVGRRRFSADFQLVFRLIKGLIFLTFVAILVTLIVLPGMTLKDILVCILAFMPTGWGLLLVSILFF